MSNLDVVAGVVGTLVSLSISYIPGFKEWFKKLSGENKRVLQLAFAVIALAILIELSCYGESKTFQCSQYGVLDGLEILFSYAVMNQATYTFTNRKNKTDLTRMP